MKTFWQLVKEFWIPFILASAWVAYIVYSDTASRSPARIIALFGGSFFLVSWATGQIVRVRRQAKVETSLTGVERRLEQLTDDLGAAASRLVNTVVGGDSFAYFVPSVVSLREAIPVILHEGQFPLSSVSVRITNLSRFQTDVAAGNPFASDTVLEIGEISPGMASSSMQIRLPLDAGAQDYNVFFSARNGIWTQMVRMREVDENWLIAWIAFRVEGDARQVLKQNIPSGFPEIGDPSFDDEPRGVPDGTSGQA